MPVYGSGGNSGPYGAGGGGYGFSPGAYGFSSGQGGRGANLPGGSYGNGGGKEPSMRVILAAVVAILVLVLTMGGIYVGVYLREGPDHEKVTAEEASSFRNATISCEVKPKTGPPAVGSGCNDYHWDGVSPLGVYVTLSGVSGVDWHRCVGFFANADGSKEESAGLSTTAYSDDIVFARDVGPGDIDGQSQLKIRCRLEYFDPPVMKLAAKFKFTIGRG